jgi:hypothetical protein
VIYHALSVKQPWATLLAHGRKTIEVRRWRTAFRGTLLIHAARISDERPEAWAHVPPELREATRQLGGIVGVGRLDSCRFYPDLETFLTDQSCHLNEPSWFQTAGLVGLCFSELRVLPYRRVPGYVKIFEVDLDDLEILPPPAPPAPQTSDNQTLEGSENPPSPVLSPPLPAGPLAAVRQRFRRLVRTVSRAKTGEADQKPN